MAERVDIICPVLLILKGKVEKCTGDKCFSAASNATEYLLKAGDGTNIFQAWEKIKDCDPVTAFAVRTTASKAVYCQKIKY